MTDAVDTLVIGPTSDSLNVRLDALPRPEPHTAIARAATSTIGGTSAGKALHLVDLGVSTTLLTTQGDDAIGERLMGRLRACGIDVRAVRTDGATERHLNLMAPTGDRVSIYLQVCGDVGTEEMRRARATALAAMGAASAVFLDLGAMSRSLIPEASALAREVWVDLHDYDGREPFHRPFREVADVVLMNDDRVDDAPAFLHRLVAEGATLAVCTRGAQGAIAVGADGASASVPAIPVEVVDTNGAGDAFAAGVMAAALEEGGAAALTGGALEAALERGAWQAARAVTSPHLSPLLETPRR